MISGQFPISSLLPLLHSLLPLARAEICFETIEYILFFSENYSTDWSNSWLMRIFVVIDWYHGFFNTLWWDPSQDVMRAACLVICSWKTRTSKRLLTHNRSSWFVVDIKVTSCIFQNISCFLDKISVFCKNGPGQSKWRSLVYLRGINSEISNLKHRNTSVSISSTRWSQIQTHSRWSQIQRISFARRKPKPN